MADRRHRDKEACDINFRCKDGTALRMRVNASPLFDEQEQPSSTLVIVPDLP